MTCGTQWPIGRLHEAFFLFLWLVFIQNCLNSHHMYLCICMCVYICKYGFTYVHFVFCTLVFFFPSFFPFPNLYNWRGGSSRVYHFSYHFLATHQDSQFFIYSYLFMRLFILILTFSDVLILTSLVFKLKLTSCSQFETDSHHTEEGPVSKGEMRIVLKMLSTKCRLLCRPPCALLLNGYVRTSKYGCGTVLHGVGWPVVGYLSNINQSASVFVLNSSRHLTSMAWSVITVSLVMIFI